MFTNRITKLFFAGSAITVLAFLLQDISVRANGLSETPSVVAYGNALELQYAHPQIRTSVKAFIQPGNTLEMQYAQPWVAIPTASSNALEIYYAQPWLQDTKPTGNDVPTLACQSSVEMLYACTQGNSP